MTYKTGAEFSDSVNLGSNPSSPATVKTDISAISRVLDSADNPDIAEQKWNAGRTEPGTARYHTPHPSVHRFELFIGLIVGVRPCAFCGQPRGYGQPVIALDHRFYHPPCGRIVERTQPPRPYNAPDIEEATYG